jgi:hypothetical protein
MEHGLHTVIAVKVKEHDLDLGQQSKHALLQAVQPKSLQFLETSLNILHAVCQVVQLALEAMAHGQHTVTVFKGNVLDHDPGQLYKLTLIPAVTAVQQK